MKLIIAAVGHRMPAWVQAGWDEYARRLPADCAIVLREIRPEPRNTGKTPAQMMAAEAERLEAALPAGAWRIALDERGRDMSTAALARDLAAWRGDGRQPVFLVGGPDGLDEGLKQRSQERWRLSSLTLPHPLVRVLLAEQLYRAWSLMTGHPYHRA